ncbi:hypothetical protein B0J12DRAFT_575464 [Macrophomina phaseolina]|uniref:Linalool dehydratase/isomerase domain-containing protein n=1 Tax=Macrophomina phaseolina TaxID=35725 RepID=A0ABQ8G7E5_9PEZI|nr:hypothetical protein B0J12DRAFT_575464 [Macrophomina phaseolina]
MRTGLPELIPENVGSGLHRKKVQNRALATWSSLGAIAVYTFYQKPFGLSAPSRAAILGLVFPGAGYVACGNWLGWGLLVLTILTQPFVLFAWFGAGGIFFVIIHWSFSILGAYFAAEETLFEQAGYINVAILFSTFVYFRLGASNASRKGHAHRQKRNVYLPSTLSHIDASALPPSSHGSRELSLAALRNIQYIIETSLKDVTDFSDIDTVDQFQTAARRYKLYERMYVLATYMTIYTPNCHAYVAEAYRKLIEKSLLPPSLGYWRWEKLWGHFSPVECDPVRRDNIMVTGFLLQGVALYTGITGDWRYTRPASLRFRVTDAKVYDYDIHSLDEAILSQWARNPWCLFPCEPNWIYTMCNLQGRIGQTVYDRIFGKTHARDTGARFEHSLDTNFTDTDGSILTIRSELTGFTIPGICGALNTLAMAMLTRGHLDHVSRRCYAIFREENVRLDELTGELHLVGLVGADKIDPGNYKPSDMFIYGQLGVLAGEFGDEAVRVACVRHMQKTAGTVTLPSGATRVRHDKGSDLVHSLFTRAQFIGREDWKTTVMQGPPKVALDGPVLSSVPYPGVLVAKAWSYTGSDLDLVLYPSDERGIFKLGIEKLQPSRRYRISRETVVSADVRGCLKLSVNIEGRTELNISPA